MKRMGGDRGDVTPANPLAALSAELEAGQTVGEYRVEGKIGEGGMAMVYVAVHPLIGKRAAIKVLNAQYCTSEELVERFISEARAVNQIGHPNIVDIFSFGQLPDGRSYLVMEWLAGETLHDRLGARNLSLRESVDILLQLIDALGAAHETGIVHRDLKPENVFLVPMRGRTLVKLLDFGIAKLSDTKKQARKTRSGMIMGTPDFISPEQARARPLDYRTDLYALGVLMFRMVMGRLPFEADNAMDVVRMHLSDEPPRPRSLWPEVPEVLDDCIYRLLEKEPAKRPELSEVHACLEAVLQETIARPELARPGAPASTPASTTPRPSASGPFSRIAPATTPAPRRGPPSRELARGPRRRRAPIWIAGAAIAAAAAVWWIARAPVRPVLESAGAPTVSSAAPSSAAPSVATPSKTAEKSAPTATPTKGELVIGANAADARIQLDGRAVAATAGAATIPVDGGLHVVVVSAPGRRATTKRVEVAPGARVEVVVKLAAPSSRKHGELVDPFGGP